MSNESKKPQSEPNALLGVAYPVTQSPTPASRPEIGHVVEHGIKPVAYVPPPVTPPAGDGGAEMVSE